MVSPLHKRIPARFYATAQGAEPVRAFLQALDHVDRKIIGTDIATVEFGWPIGMPVCRPLGGGLFEVRSGISRKRIVRILFSIRDGEIILLHAFVKKTQKTPVVELNLAIGRMKEMDDE
jgi:phage-related protein